MGRQCYSDPMNLIPRTIRGQIVTAFLVCFAFMAIIIALNYNNFRRWSESMLFFELAEDLNSTILEMRRYEKNYFLYRQGFNYEENLTYTNRLALTLQRERNNLIKAIGGDNYRQFVKYVQDYSTLMAQLRQSSCDSGGCPDLQALVRGAGQNLLILADQLVVTERRIIDHLIQQMIPLPLISLILLFVLLGFVIFFIGEKVIRPLARITRESEAVARGLSRTLRPIAMPKMRFTTWWPPSTG